MTDLIIAGGLILSALVIPIATHLAYRRHP